MPTPHVKAAILVALLVSSGSAWGQKFQTLAQNPPMGWNSWNRFGCEVDEARVKKTADAMVSSGMKDVGYQYVVIDDCWQGERDRDGFIQPNAKRFPGGIRKLADYVHAKGLRLGIYSDAGWKTCGGRPGSRGYEFQDGLTYSRWGIDYLKYDWCNTDKLNAEEAYTTMRNALHAAKRPVVFSICEWGNNEPWKWGKDVGHLWRTTGDITACFDCVVEHGTWTSWGVLQILDTQSAHRAYAGPGHWNDPDMLEVGNGMSAAEDRAHFSLWAMLAAPLMAGNDLAQMSSVTRTILTNREVIAVDQDPRGIQGFSYLKRGDLQIWAKPLRGSDLALCFLNRGSVVQDLRFDWAEHAIEDNLIKTHFDFKKQSYQVRDLWAHRDVGTTEQPLVTAIQPHDVLMLRLHPRMGR